MRTRPLLRKAVSGSIGSMTIETNSFETMFISGTVHLRPHSHETFSFETSRCTTRG